MGDFILLKFLDKFRGLYNSVGVDYDKMRLILGLKLTMDQRRVPTVMNNNDEKKDGKNKFLFSLFFYAFMGLMVGAMTFLPIDRMYTYTMFFSIFMFLILTVFISDFSSVLLDVRDKNLIGIRGVDNRTINAAKITHICYYIFAISLALGWLSIIASFRLGLKIGLLFILEIIIVDIFMIVITALLYFIILKFFDGEKVKDIINFVQIILTVGMAIGYQIVGRVFNFVDMNIVYEEKLYQLLLPPMWFSAPLYIVNGGKRTTFTTILIGLAIIVPLVAIIIYVKQIPNFENYLVKLNNNALQEKSKRKGVFYNIGLKMCKDKSEKAYYGFATSIIKREREFKLRVYPSLGFTIAFPLLFILIFSNPSEYANFREWKLAVESSKSYLNLYFFATMIPSMIIMMRYSNNYKGAWIFKATPLINEDNIFKGTYKSLIFNLLLPIYICQAVIFILLFNYKVIIHLIVGLLFIIGIIPIFMKINKPIIPFSEEININDKGGSILNMFLSFAILGAGAFIHSQIVNINYGILIYGIFLLVSNYILWNKATFSRKTSKS